MSEDAVIPMRQVPINFGPLKGFDGNARMTGPCGDTMEFWVLIQNNCVVFASYITDGCSSSMACGYSAAALATGQPVQKALEITEHEVLSVAGDIPDESKHCALLSCNVLKAAISGYFIKEERISLQEDSGNI